MTFSDPVLIIAGTFLIHQTLFWIYNGLILLFTHVFYPNEAKKCKIQKVRTVNEEMFRPKKRLTHLRTCTSTIEAFENVPEWC